MTSPKTVARFAGSIYLAGSILFVLALLVRKRILNGDTAHVADHIRASAGLFRVGLASDLVSWTGFVMLGMALYALLHHVHRLAAAALVVFVAVQAAIGYLNDSNLYTALAVATHAGDAHGL